MAFESPDENDRESSKRRLLLVDSTPTQEANLIAAGSIPQTPQTPDVVGHGDDERSPSDSLDSELKSEGEITVNPVAATGATATSRPSAFVGESSGQWIQFGEDSSIDKEGERSISVRALSLPASTNPGTGLQNEPAIHSDRQGWNKGQHSGFSDGKDVVHRDQGTSSGLLMSDPHIGFPVSSAVSSQIHEQTQNNHQETASVDPPNTGETFEDSF